MKEFSSEEITFGVPLQLDSFGRITIPVGFRRYIGMENDTYVVIFVNENDDIVIRPISAIRG